MKPYFQSLTLEYIETLSWNFDPGWNPNSEALTPVRNPNLKSSAWLFSQIKFGNPNLKLKLYFETLVLNLEGLKVYLN